MTNDELGEAMIEAATIKGYLQAVNDLREAEKKKTLGRVKAMTAPLSKSLAQKKIRLDLLEEQIAAAIAAEVEENQ